LFLSFATSAYSAEPVWKRVLSGEITASPVVVNDSVYVQTSDRMVTCLSSNGEFRWSKPLPGKSTPFFSVMDHGLVVSVSSPGILTASNLDGSFLWQLRGGELPVASPYAGRDGRIFIVYRSRIVCLSIAGIVKWTLPIDESASGALSETGEGDLLVVCSGLVMLRVSPYGELLERIPLINGTDVFFPVSGGFLAGTESGFVRSYDVRNGRAVRNDNTARIDSETVWEFRGKASVAALERERSSVYVLDSSGTLIALNVTDGSVLWSVETGITAEQGASLSFEYGQLNGVTHTGAFAADDKGNILWNYSLVADSFLPLLSESGLAYTVSTGALLMGWRVESRIKSGKTAQKSEYYGILNGKSGGYGIPDGPDSRSTLSFLETVSAELQAGTVSTDEVHYARKLSEIVHGDTGFGPFAAPFDPSVRARSATLLGRLGSDEYRRTLVDTAVSVTDPTVATGILLGLASCGPDTDGAALETIDRLLRNCPADETVLRAACDALYAIIRFSSGEASLDGTRYLARFLGDGETPRIRDYARKLLENVLE
jgi:outer membrane protein assembly factor BamB